MYYKIIEKFGSKDGEKWQNYLEWRGLDLTDFNSVDGILRPDLFIPESDEDWQHCATEINKTSLITSLDYATQILDRYENSDLVGVEIELEQGYIPKDGFLGFDLIDDYGDVSLVANWGTDEENIVNTYVMPNGLIGDLDQTLQIRNRLREKYPDDSHAENCHVWAVYRIDTGQEKASPKM